MWFNANLKTVGVQCLKCTDLLGCITFSLLNQMIQLFGYNYLAAHPQSLFCQRGPGRCDAVEQTEGNTWHGGHRVWAHGYGRGPDVSQRLEAVLIGQLIFGNGRGQGVQCL